MRFQLVVLEQRQSSVIHAMRNMMAEFMRDNSRSESGGAGSSATVGGSLRRPGSPPVPETRGTAAGGIDKSESGRAEGVAVVGEAQEG